MKNFLISIYALLLFNSANSQTKNEVVLQVIIENKNWDHVYIKDQDYNTVQIIDINEEGTFNSKLSIQDGLYYLFDGTEYFKIYLKNGYNLQLSMDTNNYRESIKYTGIGADVNNFLVSELNNEVAYDYGKLSNTKKNKQLIKLINEKENESIKRLKSNPTFDKNFVALELNSYKLHSDELKKYYGELREMN
jgi:hypothetical protein